MSFFHKEELKYLGLFYLSIIIQTLFAITEPIIVVYFALKGFSYAELSFALVAYFVAPFLFEVPTGIVADIFGRKRSVILSLILIAIGIMYVPFVASPIVLAGLFFFIGFAKTLSTGADQAWIVDNLRYNKKPDLVHEYYVKSQSFNMGAFVISGLISAGLILALGEGAINFLNIDLIGLDLLFFVQGAGLIITAVILMFAQEHFVAKRIDPKHLINHSIAQFRSGFRHSLDHPVIFHLILAAFFAALAGGVFGIVYQPYLIGLGVPTHYLAYLTSIIGVLGIFVPFIAKRLLGLIGKVKYYLSFVSTVQAILIFSLFFIVSPLVGLAFIVLVSNIGHLEKPIEKPYFQKFLKPRIRSTVASFESMFVHIGGAIAMLVGGFLADLVGPKKTFIAAGLLIIPMVWSYLSIREKQNN